MRKFVFKRQLKNKGCYVEFGYDLKFAAGRNCGVHFNYLADLEWELPCRMGLQLFSEYLYRRRAGVLELTIYKVNWYPADTNNIVVMFALIKALGECLDLELPGLELDVSSEVFKFPEPRSIVSRTS